jgi:hypothetical protein
LLEVSTMSARNSDILNQSTTVALRHRLAAGLVVAGACLVFGAALSTPLAQSGTAGTAGRDGSVVLADPGWDDPPPGLRVPDGR